MSTNKSHPCRATAWSFILLCGLTASAQSVNEVETAVPPPELPDIKTSEPAAPCQAPLSDALPVGPLQLNVDQAKPAPRPAGTGFLAGMDRTRVYFDQPGDGAIWAAGDSYKASFDAHGATYIPFFGSRAPQNFPVHLRIETITIGGVPIVFDGSVQPVRAGNRIVFDRGLVDEVYDLSPDSIEQSFVFQCLPARGELLVRLAVDTELARDVDAQGLVLSGTLGSVRYGNAVSFDASGVRSAAPTAFEGDAITLRVAAEQVARARGVLVIDPLISTITIDGNTAEDHETPDVAYDSEEGRYQVVYERAFSSADHDVYAKQYGSSFTLVTGSEAFIDLSANYWADPQVADNAKAGQFLTVAEVGPPTGGARTIRGRTRSADTLAQGIQFLISSTDGGDKHSPDVGGDSNYYFSGTQYYCVVWQRDLTSTDTDVHARLVAPTATTFGGTIYLSNSGGTLDSRPAISKTNGSGFQPSQQRWNISWTRSPALFEADLYAAQIDWDGTIVTPPFAVDTTSANTTDSSPSSPLDGTPLRWLLTYTRRSSAFADPQIYGRLMQDAVTLDTADLTALSGSPSGEIQSAPSADCDGVHFAVAHSESYQGTVDRDIYIASFSTFGNQLVCAEGHKNLASTWVVEDEVEIACQNNVILPYTFAAWHQQTSAGNGDIEGALYLSRPFTIICQPGIDGVIACPCGNHPSAAHRGCDNSAATGGASLIPTGDLYPDTVTLTAFNMLPTGIAIFMQGDGTSDAGTVNGVPFGAGVQCIGGHILRLAVKTIQGGAASYPSGDDQGIRDHCAAIGAPIYVHSKRYYQVYYRDPASFACASGGALNLTDGVQVDW